MADKTTVFKFNQTENKNRIDTRTKLVNLNKILRSNCNNITKCVLYSTDVDADKITTILPTQKNDYAVVEIFDKDNNPNKFELAIKMTQGVLIANKYKVLASKKFKKEYPVCKIVVKLV